jgi:hypothetical protein
VSDERERAADELRRIREAVRDRALLEPVGPRLPPSRPTRPPEGPAPSVEPFALPAAARPGNEELNRLWDVAGAPASRLGRLLRRWLRPLLDRQQAFNSKQVQFDNELLAWVEARLDGTHRHYDEVLGVHRRHMAEIDERHLILQEELVAHVHDLVRRIDLVLAESEKGRLRHEHALRDLQERLRRLEARAVTAPPEATPGG